jgi:hypothetical protein
MTGMLSMMLNQFPLFFTIGFLGTFMINLYYAGISFKTLKESGNLNEFLASSAVMPLSVYLVVLIVAYTWKISLPLLGVLFILSYLSRS